MASAAESMNISRQTAHKWWRRYRELGVERLADRSSRPRRCPTQTSARVERRGWFSSMVATILDREGTAMHTRVVTFTGVKDFEGGIAFVRDEVVPILNEQKGYRGTTVSADRSGGVLGVLSLWDTAADREASFGALAKARQQGVEITGGEMAVESFEQLVADISEPPVVGSALMVTRISMDPAKIDGNLEFFKSEVLPRIKANAGYQGLRNMVNRETGEGIVGAVWRDHESMKAAAADAQSRRGDAMSRGVNFGEVSFREVLQVELR